MILGFLDHSIYPRRRLATIILNSPFVTHTRFTSNNDTIILDYTFH